MDGRNTVQKVMEVQRNFHQAFDFLSDSLFLVGD